MAISEDTGLITTTQYGQFTDYRPDGTVYSGPNPGWPFTATGTWKSVSGVDTPHFYRRKAAGELLPHTPWSQFELEYQQTGGPFHSKQSSLWSTTGTNVVFWQRPITGVDSIMELAPAPSTSYAQSYVQSAAAAIASQGWDALTFASEAPKLKKMFKSISRKMVEFSKGHDAHRIKDLWLEGRYGYRTLAYDVRDLDNAIRNWDEERKIWTERAGFSSYDRWENTYTKTLNPNQQAVYQERMTSRHSVRGSVAARISPSRVILDPLKTGWELVPYSFIVDWVYGVGVALDAIKFLQLAQEYTASIGVESKHEYTCIVTDSPFTAPVLEHSHSGASTTCTFTVTTRTPTSVSYVPQLTGRLPTGDLILDLTALSRLKSFIK